MTGDHVEMVVRLDGVVEEILNALVEAGYFKTKAEAVRAGMLGLGKEYHILDTLRADLVHAKELGRQLKSGELELGTEAELRAAIKANKRKK